MRRNLGLLAAPESISMQPEVHRHRLDKGPSVNIVFPMRDFRKRLSAPPMPTSHPRLGVRRRLENAFTLLEILVVLLILGLLAGLAITNLDKIFGGAQVQTAELFVSQTMKLPLNAYRISMGDYPTTAEGIQALVSRPANKGERWNGPYIEGGIPLDPWKEPYQYEYPGKRGKTVSYDLWSKGPDKQSGTEDDIGNWGANTAENR
jgi:general secretion pathway protein G